MDCERCKERDDQIRQLVMFVRSVLRLAREGTNDDLWTKQRWPKLVEELGLNRDFTNHADWCKEPGDHQRCPLP